MAESSPITAKPIAAYTAAELRAIAERCLDRKASGFIVPPESVDLFAAAMRALAEKAKA